MSPRTWVDRIRDILDAISEIQAFTEDMTFESFQGDSKTIRAVEMNLIIIGEAAGEIPDEVTETYSLVPWNLMRAMRNRLAHVYFSVDERLLWQTIQDDLPKLTPQLEELIS